MNEKNGQIQSRFMNQTNGSDRKQIVYKKRRIFHDDDDSQNLNQSDDHDHSNKSEDQKHKDQIVDNKQLTNKNSSIQDDR